MTASESNLKKQLLTNTELSNIFKKYNLATTRTPYGIIGQLLEKHASHDDMYDLHLNAYFSTSLLYNGNSWY